MKIFETENKTNFVDDANVFVGFDNCQCCCEDFGYFLSQKVPEKMNEKRVEINPEGFNFDTDFFHSASPDEGGMVTFRLTKGEEEIYLTLYNAHNGYYSHGFFVKVGGVKIRDGYL